MKNHGLYIPFLITLSIAITSHSRAQWVQTNGPYEASACSFAAIDSFIFAGTIGSGVYRSSDNGVTWIPCNGEMTSTFTNCFAVSGNRIYAGSATGQGVSISTDNGTTWNAVNNGLPNFYSYALTGVIKELAASNNNVFAIINGGFVVRYLSTDNGSSCTDANTGAISGISAIAVIGDTFFVGSSNGVYKSTNKGSTWITAGLTDSVITSFVVNGANLFASTNSAVFLSTNSGDIWRPASSGLPDSGIVQLSASDNFLMAKVENKGFFLSTNSGANWTALGGTGLPSDYESPNAFTPVEANLYYGYLNDGIYRSTDDGNTWTVVNTGLQETQISAFATTRNTAFVVTASGFWYSPQSGKDWIHIPLNN